jgi:hypothetical protein
MSFPHPMFQAFYEAHLAYMDKLSDKQREEINAIKFKCNLCKEDATGYGNNPAPVKNEGRCCDLCNFRTVLPVRVAMKYS